MSLRQHGQENQVIMSQQLSMPIATMEEEIVGVSVRLNQAMSSYQDFKTASSFVGFTWLVSVNERVYF